MNENYPISCNAGIYQQIRFSKLRFIENAIPTRTYSGIRLPASTATSIVLNHTKTVVITSVCEIDYYFRILKYVCLNHGWGHFALNGDVLGSPPIHMWVEMQDGCSRHTSPGHISWRPDQKGRIHSAGIGHCPARILLKKI